MRTTGGLSKVLESTRRRLQSQLHKKETENNRLVAQIQVSGNSQYLYSTIQQYFIHSSVLNTEVGVDAAATAGGGSGVAGADERAETTLRRRQGHQQTDFGRPEETG